ncbi:PTS sugar transporter subunit IIA [Cytobacillus oceanisediminis]|jgi:PTS system mannitol-specific IIA component|uniref:Mannitol-specific phosphotransferase enzyme IIA component n=2 Tax=Niallia TaxID=2837506 RepID=A0A941JRD8_NIACI|nr:MULTISPECIES: PTS sugar transporter subunit IIA [Bacillaceae]EOR26069.1 PTS system mannitol-specific transporter subunit IIA [Niallia nealsonii AAU1]MDU1844602.1 PTS sugar transporter subunit IIA [Niallia nealsonii]MBZ9534953.1 PTS sugar transporter subunit IIA [Cytobacillus oceanisediminis]MCB5238225.1 PTS sugar transporter subunit IIA [Niallia circulans]MED3795033.1 PTS sugar transporter subunit IIA [Niallia alba]
MSILKKENIILNSSVAGKEEAIKKAGQILVDQGYVSEDYIPAMLQREEISSTYMGNFLAIPHGTDEAKTAVLNSGLSVIQAPNGVDFGDGNIVKLIIGIAGKDGEHLELLSQIAIVCSEIENVEKLVAAKSEEEIIQILSEVE